ncbi:steroid hormone receptor ERR1-like [Paramacrobiotus metropolitanus]|uniref:steroid hormone receptor ERR1-like n=1 Tax=Paramacrobiotus metropolitanus TaxID=2943436 RepID=UPI00244629C7|nr:steroid hormone receptor ERR1-like [Paramacrobiotus metropolitanus]
MGKKNGEQTVCSLYLPEKRLQLIFGENCFYRWPKLQTPTAVFAISLECEALVPHVYLAICGFVLTTHDFTEQVRASVHQLFGAVYYLSSTKLDDKKHCLVCGDASSGYHYGVNSCEACKAFFKRTIQGSIEYKCGKSRNCPINKSQRKACQACRYRKCLSVGMLKEGVRLDRVRGGRQKYKRNVHGEPTSTEPTTSRPLPPKNPYNTRGNPTAELDGLLFTLLSNEPAPLAAAISEPLDNGSKVQTAILDAVDRELVAVISWAKLVPGFLELPLNDQMHLLQTTWCEIVIFSFAARSMESSSPNCKSLTFATNLMLTSNMATEACFEDVYTKTIQLVEYFNEYRLTREEYVLMKCLVLLNGGCPLENPNNRNLLREMVMQTLCQYVNNISRIGSLLMLLPHLRQLDGMTRRFWLILKEAGKVTVPKLLLEMLESAQKTHW